MLKWEFMKRKDWVAIFDCHAIPTSSAFIDYLKMDYQLRYGVSATIRTPKMAEESVLVKCETTSTSKRTVYSKSVAIRRGMRALILRAECLIFKRRSPSLLARV
ncbi:hypothetical protein AVEN_128732-1 [Araneus ventricosus]|uniref:Uncharacterized protein n=1 Tax=Araneus ventricosus TaxID=182803 RepID=A0A4Y2Q782_ARAVE|nr:hypothetical protein AVEN_128732-1 [Araneus ventricosus]